MEGHTGTMPACHHAYLQVFPGANEAHLLQQCGCFIPSRELSAFSDVLPNEYLSLALQLII